MTSETATHTIAIASLTEPDAIAAVIPDLARLRISVFREFPYLYDGSLDYEADYLKLYARTPGAIVVTAQDEAEANRIVGAATALPLAAEHEELLSAFREAGMAIDDLYYCAESVLEAPYRGRGLGHAFFDRREAQAWALGFGRACFLSVERPSDHPRRPADHRDLDAFWQRRGYEQVPGFQASFSWQDLDEAAPSPKPMGLGSSRPLSNRPLLLAPPRHTHARTHTRTHARTHAHAHTHTLYPTPVCLCAQAHHGSHLFAHALSVHSGSRGAVVPRFSPSAHADELKHNRQSPQVSSTSGRIVRAMALR